MKEERARKEQPVPILNRFEYLHLVWDRGIKPTLFGIQGHRSITRDPDALLIHNLVLLAFAAAIVRGLRMRKDDRLWLYFAAIAAGYVAFLIGVFHYGSYRTTHSAFLGIQGRYIAPIAIPAYLLAAEMLLRIFGGRLRIAVLALVAGIFIAGDLPYFLQNDTPEWYTSTRATENRPNR